MIIKPIFIIVISFLLTSSSFARPVTVKFEETLKGGCLEVTSKSVDVAKEVARLQFIVVKYIERASTSYAHGCHNRVGYHAKARGEVINIKVEDLKFVKAGTHYGLPACGNKDNTRVKITLRGTLQCEVDS